MRTRRPVTRGQWAVFFAGWAALFGLNLLVGWWKEEEPSEGEVLVALTAAAILLAIGVALFQRRRRGR